MLFCSCLSLIESMALSGKVVRTSHTLSYCTHFFSFFFFQLSLYFSLVHSWHVYVSVLSPTAHSFSLLHTLTLCLSTLTLLVPVPLPLRKSVGLSASSLSPHHADPIAQSQRPLPDQLPSRVQIFRRPFCLPEARQVPGGHCFLRGREREGRGEDREGGKEGDRNLQRDIHPHIRQVYWTSSHEYMKES